MSLLWWPSNYVGRWDTAKINELPPLYTVHTSYDELHCGIFPLVGLCPRHSSRNCIHQSNPHCFTRYCFCPISSSFPPDVSEQVGLSTCNMSFETEVHLLDLSTKRWIGSVRLADTIDMSSMNLEQSSSGVRP
jgi:hypothetical protein